MNDELDWDQLLEEFLDYVEDTTGARDPANVIATLRNVVSRWISFALDQGAHPEARNDPLLNEWVTSVLTIGTGPQRDYRARVRRWWQWNEDRMAIRGANIAPEAARCWVVRAGREGEAVEHNLANDVVTIGWGGASEFERVAHCGSREEFRDLIDEALPDWLESGRRSACEQIWRFAREIEVGDLVVMPVKGMGPDGDSFAIGRVNGPYEFDSSRQPDFLRQRRSVTWLRTEIERKTVREDLRKSLDAAMTVFGLRRHDAARRIHHLAEHGVDPGPRNAEPASDDVATWLLTLESYLHWRGWAGGNEGQSAKPGTIDTVRSVVSGWLRWACDNGIDPGQADETALGTYLDSKQNASDDTRSGYARHIRRWWRRLPQFTEARPERLAKLVAEFREDGNDGVGYPSDADGRHKQVRAEYEQILRSLPSMSWENREQVKAVWPMHAQGVNFGGAGLGSGTISKTVNDASAEQWPEIRSALWQLCFGQQDEDAERFDSAVDGPVKGLAELVATRMLAICHPDRFLANFKLQVDDPDWPGTFQLAQLMCALVLLNQAGRSEVEALASADLGAGVRGSTVARTHAVLVSTLEPHFSEHGVPDTWGMRGFLYWLAQRFPELSGSVDPYEIGNSDDDESGSARSRLAASLKEAEKELLCVAGFLDDVVELLEDKGQVILYGPPGTGKTYLAQRLARALTASRSGARSVDDDGSCGDGTVSLVQFHPAYSYEDFFEGFRPRVEAGNMTYSLTPGPLVRIADAARANPSQRYVMVIDEINRTNLPRVLGELLFLLEYRDRAVHTQYRPSEQFRLPKNLWFIGTMNTADRSIALIDAAMRRRFHFVPFFPNHGPTKGLLRRWMQRNSQGDEWVARLVEQVNDELVEQMGGDHALIGPSYFMKENLDESGLQRIWEYNIEPLIEDHFFGRRDVIESFRFQQVWSRFGPDATKPDAESTSPSGSGEEVGQTSVDDGGVVDEDDA